MTVYETVSWQHALAEHTDAWQALTEEGGFNPTLGPSWGGVVAENWQLTGRLRVFVETRDGQLKNILPYYTVNCRIYGIPCTKVEFLSNLVSYHVELISSANPTKFFQRFLEIGIGQDWHLVWIENLLKASPTQQAIDEIASSGEVSLIRWPADRTAYLALKGSWEDVMANKGQKFRHRLRKRAREIAKLPDFELRWVRRRSAVPDLMDAMLYIEERSWKAKEGIAVSNRDFEISYYRRLLPMLAAKGALLAAIVYASGRPIAYNLACTWGDWIGGLKTSYDPAYRKYSPGAFLVDQIVENAFTSGAREYDFLGELDQHKKTWTRDERGHEGVIVFSKRFRGRIIGGVKRLASRMSEGQTMVNQKMSENPLR